MKIDRKIHNELRRRFNPEGSDLRRVQLKQLEMLAYIDEVCKRNNISYWLAAGNLLGYHRHYGEFIPWDDDIDIELEKSEYKRLVAALKEEYHPDFIIQDGFNDRYFEMHFAKLRYRHSIIEEKDTELYRYRGCYIDIFPMGRNLPIVLKLTTVIRARIFGELAKINNLFLRKFMTSMAKITLQRILFPAINASILPFTRKDVIFHTPTSVGSDFNPRELKKIFPLKRGRFENVEVSIPYDTAAFLEDMYGDYMEIPTPDKLHFHFDKNMIQWIEQIESQ